MPLVIECGMPLETFWHDDMRLLECYSTAHYNRLNYTAWINGARVREAIVSVFNDKVKYSPKCDKIKKVLAKNHQIAKKDDVYEFNEWVHSFRKMKGVSDDGNV